MWIRKTLVLLAVVASTVVMPARPALACSCMPIDAASALGEVPAAFVGTVVDVRDADNPSEFEDVVFTFRVDEWVKGGLGETVEMRSSAYGASCGFEMSPGQQSGVLVRDVGERLSGGLCDRVDADVLRLASEPLALPTGSGPISFLVPGSFGDVGVIALDATGGVLGYGPRPSDDPFYFPNVSICPGSRRLVELIGDETIIVRDVASLQIVEETRVGVPQSESGYAYFNSVACRSEDATEIFVFGMAEEFSEEEELTEEEYFSNQRGVVYARGSEGSFELFFEGQFGGEGPRVLVGEHYAVATSGFREAQLIVLDLETGLSRVLHAYDSVPGSEDPPFVEGMAMSPDGRLVATMDANFVDRGVDYYLTVLDLEADEAFVARAKMPEYGQIAWVDDGTIAYAFDMLDDAGEPIPGEESATVQLLDASDLTESGRWTGWNGHEIVVIDGVLYGVAGAKLVSAPVATGPMTEVWGFPGSVQGLYPVTDGPEIDPSAAARPPQSTGSTVPPATALPLGAPTVVEAGADAHDVDDETGSASVLVIAVVAGALAIALVGLALRRRRRTADR